MKYLLPFAIGLLLMSLLIQCGGSKKVASREYEQLSTQDRLLYLNEQINKNPKNIELKKSLYSEYLQLGMEDQALAVMEEIIKQDQDQKDVIFQYGELQYKRGNSRIAYASFRDVLQGPQASRYQTQISNYIAGSYLVQQITSSPDDEAFASFSPDGTYLVYQKRIGNNWEIYQMDFATQSEKLLVSSASDDELPVISSDGYKIYYTSTSDDKRPINSNVRVRDIYSSTINGNYLTNLTQTVADDWLPRFNNIGTKVLFVSDRNDLQNVPYSQKQSDIFIMESNGDFQIALTESPANEGGSCFNSDGTKIFYHSNKNGNYDIFVMDEDGDHPMTIIDNRDGDDVNPCASPVSDEIVFFSNRDGNYEIYRALSDGSNQERLTFHPAGDFNPSFSNDGRNVVFHSNRNGNLDLFLINLDVKSSTPNREGLISRLNELIK
jgi:Tol biopolymer transport system component